MAVVAVAVAAFVAGHCFCYFCLHSIQFNSVFILQTIFSNDDLALIRRACRLLVWVLVVIVLLFSSLTWTLVVVVVIRALSICAIIAAVLLAYRAWANVCYTTRWLTIFSLLSMHNFKMHCHIKQEQPHELNERADVQALHWHEHVKYKYWMIN